MYGSSVVCAYVSVQVLRSSALVTTCVAASQQHMFIQATYVRTYVRMPVSQCCIYRVLNLMEDKLLMLYM